MNQNFLFGPTHFGSHKKPKDCSLNKLQLVFEFGLEDDIKRLLISSNVVTDISDLKILKMGSGFHVSFYHYKAKKEIIKLMKNIMERDERYKNIRFEEFKPKDDRNVYVKYLPINYTKEKLKELFSKYGEIISVKLMTKNQNQNQIAFVRYKESQDAQKAIEEINRQKIRLLDRPIYCELSLANQANASNSFDTLYNNKNNYQLINSYPASNLSHMTLSQPVSPLQSLNTQAHYQSPIYVVNPNISVGSNPSYDQNLLVQSMNNMSIEPQSVRPVPNFCFVPVNPYYYPQSYYPTNNIPYSQFMYHSNGNQGGM